MTVTNLSQIIRDDCVIVCPDGSEVSAKQLKTLKNFYKQAIYHSLLGRTVGKVIVLWTNDLDVILPASCAMWELGCAMAVHGFQKRAIEHPAFADFYRHIDLVIGPDDSTPVMTHLPHILVGDIQRGGTNTTIRQKLLSLDPNQYPDQEYVLDKPLDEQTVCAVSHTSGTTGKPKIFDITHENAIALVYANIKLFDFVEYDRVMHCKTLHHGSLFLNYAVPAWATTNEHHWAINPEADPLGALQRMLQTCKDNNITKFLIPYNWIRLLPQLKSVDLSGTDLVTIVGPKNDEMLDILERFKPRNIYNNFGCTEVGTLAVSRTNQLNVADYTQHRFQCVNPLIEIKTEPSFFWVKFKNETEWKTVGDILDITNGVLTWHGRNNILTVNNEKIDVRDLTTWFETRLNGQGFSLVPDFELNQLYLALYISTDLTLDALNQDLANKFGPNCQIAKLGKFDQFFMMSGMKASQPLLLYAFRKQETRDATI